MDIDYSKAGFNWIPVRHFLLTDRQKFLSCWIVPTAVCPLFFFIFFLYMFVTQVIIHGYLVADISEHPAQNFKSSFLRNNSFQVATIILFLPSSLALYIASSAFFS